MCASLGAWIKGPIFIDNAQENMIQVNSRPHKFLHLSNKYLLSIYVPGPGLRPREHNDE